MAGDRVVLISDRPAGLDDVIAVARGARVALDDTAVDVLRASREVVDAAIERGDAVYGVTTGLGHARNERLPVDALVELQPVFVEMHLGAVGEPLPTAHVRAAMAVRAIGFARGGAGVSVGMATGLVDLLNHGIHPVVPAHGSVGAGDLSQMAVVGRALLGRGDVIVDGDRRPAAQALADAGLRPVQMQPKDGLAILAGNAVSIGAGILVAERVAGVLGLADLVVATTMEMTHANPSIVDPAVADVRASHGQVATSDAIRVALDGSARTSPAAGLSVQDPLTLRVVPQVHGAARDVLSACSDALLAELNAASDNPLVDRASGRLISNGNFHPMQVALGFESLRVALAHVGLLAERRMGHLWDEVISGLSASAMPADGPGGAHGTPALLAGLSLRYAAAARYTRLRFLAQPVTLDVPVLDLGVEDHAPNTLETVWTTSEAVDVLEELLITELLIAVAGLSSTAAHEGLGRGTADLVERVSSLLHDVPAGTPPDQIHRLVTARLNA